MFRKFTEVINKQSERSVYINMDKVIAVHEYRVSPDTVGCRLRLSANPADSIDVKEALDVVLGDDYKELLNVGRANDDGRIANNPVDASS